MKKKDVRKVRTMWRGTAIALLGAMALLGTPNKAEAEVGTNPFSFDVSKTIYWTDFGNIPSQDLWFYSTGSTGGQFLCSGSSGCSGIDTVENFIFWASTDAPALFVVMGQEARRLQESQ